MDKYLSGSLFAILVCLVYSQAHALRLNGFTDFSRQVVLNARQPGIIQSVVVSAGQSVKQGGMLLELDDTPLQLRLEKARAETKALQPAVETAEQDLLRAQELFDRDSLSQLELRNAEIKLAAVSGNLQSAQAEADLAEYWLQQAVLRAPFNAIVLQVFVQAGEYVDPATEMTPMIHLVEKHRMRARAVLKSEQWSTKLLERKASVTYRGKTYSGQVTELGMQRVKQAGGLPAYEVFVTFDTDQPIAAEMPVTITIK